MWFSAKLPCIFALSVSVIGGSLPWAMAQGSCESNRDCKLVANYCGGCNCEAKPAASADDVVDCPPDEPTVACFADPCSFGKFAVCDDGGQCAISESETVSDELTFDPTLELINGTFGPTLELMVEPTSEPTVPELDTTEAGGLCQLCQDGSPVPNPDQFLGAYQTSCGDLATEAQSLPFYPCEVYHYFGALCGCPNQAPPPDGCKLCKDSAGTVTTPDKVLNNSTNETCATVELEAAYITAEVYECGLYHILGNDCGCNNAPPEHGCRPLCNDGSPVPEPDRSTRYGVCSEMEEKALFNPSNLTCDDSDIAYQGLLCGCNNTPPADACGPLCKDKALPDPDKLLLSVGLSCGEIEELSTWDSETECPEYEMYASLCGCNNSAPEGACGPLCEDGSALPSPQRVVYGDTCQFWDGMSIFDTRSDACVDYRFVGAICGCNNTVPENGCGPLCGANETIPDPDKKVYGQSCEQWDWESLFDIYSGEYCSSTYGDVAYMCGCDVGVPSDGCGPLCFDGAELPDPEMMIENTTCSEWELQSLFDFDGPLEGWCGEYQYYGNLCGCNNPPPADGCLLCDDPLANPDRISSDVYGTSYTCEEDANYYLYSYKETDVEECNAFKSVFGPFCGCPTNPDKICSICPEGERTTTDVAPDFIYKDDFYGDVPLSDEKCVTIEFLTNLDAYDEESCNNIQTQISSGCCEKSEEAIDGGTQEEDAEGETPTMSPLPEPTSSPSGANGVSVLITGVFNIVVATSCLFFCVSI